MTRRTILLTLVGVVLAPVLLFACSLPVFRYALEHWQPNPYRVLVYHDKPWSEGDAKWLAWVKDQRLAGANVEIRTVDLSDSTTPLDQARWNALPESQRDAPRLIVQMPARSRAQMGSGEALVGTAPWNETEIRNLLASPNPAELGKRLVAGEVVWVFLESGEKAVDDRLFALLNDELATLQRTLKLPEIKAEDLADRNIHPDRPKIRFSSLRVSRTDPAERWFVEMLLSVEADLRTDDVVNQSMVFPVFGRGRALYALTGEGIQKNTIHEAAAFLIGACQCTVKAETPGVDLLLPVDWEGLVEKSAPKLGEVSLTGLGRKVPLASPPVAPPAESAIPASVLWVLATVLLVLVAIVGLIATSKLRRS